MRTNILKITTLSVIASSILMASGYKIPETSVNSLALGGANIAHVKHADAAYDNPANMIFMDDSNYIEGALMLVKSSPTNYKGTYGNDPSQYDIDAEKQAVLVPSLHYVSEKIGNIGARVGFCVVVPGGLTREWKEQPAQRTAEKFALKVIEFNPTVALSITDNIAFAAGFRVLYSEGEVKSTYDASRDMEGSSVDYGYNFALSYKPTKNIDLAVTYRSNVDLSTEGNAKLYIGDAKVYDGGASLTVPIPAALNIAMAYTFETKTTVEFVYEKTYWSAYETIDFNYKSEITPILRPSFDDPVKRNWRDSEAYRLGLTQELESVTLMAGFIIDKTPTPEATLGFESPGNDSMALSFGGRFEIADNLEMGLAALYTMKEDRKVHNYNKDGSDNINGELTNSNVLLVSAGLGYKF